MANIAKKIIGTVSASFEIGRVKVSVQPSIGIALYPSDGETPEVLLKYADATMYKAKHDRTGYCFFH